MVNGIADSQQRGRMALSVNRLAESAGISRLLVDVRHEATHNELPSLSTLRLAASQALEWLVCNYWCVNTAADTTSYLHLSSAAGVSAAADSRFAGCCRQLPVHVALGNMPIAVFSLCSSQVRVLGRRSISIPATSSFS